MAAKHNRKDEPPWYRRPLPVILGAGACAAAIGSILALWDRFEDPPDHVAITRAVVIQQATLGEFAARMADVDTSISASAASSVTIVMPAAAVLSAARPASAATPAPSDEAVPSPTDEPTASPSGPAVPTPMETATLSPSESPSATPTPTPTASQTRPSGDSAKLRSGLHRWPPPDEYLVGVFENSDVENRVPNWQVLRAMLDWIDRDDPDGDPLPANRAAELLAQDLRQVESRRQGDKLDPVGWVVAVDLEVRGMRGDPLLLAWSLGGLDGLGNWTSERVAYRLTADRDQDMGSVEVWVPDLEQPGTYRVELKLARASSGDVLTSDGADIPEE